MTDVKQVLDKARGAMGGGYTYAHKYSKSTTYKWYGIWGLQNLFTAYVRVCKALKSEILDGSVKVKLSLFGNGWKEVLPGLDISSGNPSIRIVVKRPE